MIVEQRAGQVRWDAFLGYPRDPRMHVTPRTTVFLDSAHAEQRQWADFLQILERPCLVMIEKEGAPLWLLGPGDHNLGGTRFWT